MCSVVTHIQVQLCTLFFKLFPCVTLFLLADDRSVHDSERRAAIMHFTSDQVLVYVITTINMTCDLTYP